MPDGSGPLSMKTLLVVINHRGWKYIESGRRVAQSPVVTIKALLFDLDGTLLDHDSAAATAITRSLPGTDPSRVTGRWAELEHEAMDRYLSGELTFNQQRRMRITTLATELGLGTWDTAHADTWFTEYLKHYQKAAWSAYPDVRPALDRLPLPKGVLTNGDNRQQQAKLRHLGLTKDFPFLFTSSDAGAAKPAPEIFHLACTRLNLAPVDVAYVGDRLHAQAATNAGLYGIWLDRTREPTTITIPRITTLNELPALLAARGLPC